MLTLGSPPSAPQARLQGSGNADALTLERARTLILPEVEFDATDVRDAVRRLFRRGLFGGTIAPDVQGTVTMRLRNLPWETALQNVLRQVEATYRLDHGFFEIVPRENAGGDLAPESPLDRDVEAIEDAYRRIGSAVAQGRRDGLLSMLGPDFSVREGETSLSGESAVRRLVEVTRAYPRIASEKIGPRGKQIGGPVVRVRYACGTGETLLFRDRWLRTPAGLRLASRVPEPEPRAFVGPDPATLQG